MGTLFRTPRAVSAQEISQCLTMASDPAEEAKHKAQLNEQLKEYISEWRKTREKEEVELKKLKEKQAKRKEIRAEQEKKLNQQKKEEEEKLRKEENEKKAKEAEEKKKRLEEAEAKRQEMLESQKASKEGAGGAKKSAGGAGNDARREMTKTKEQLEEEKKIALSIRIKPLELESLDSDEIKAKAEELFKIIVQLETDKYDYEQRRETQGPAETEGPEEGSGPRCLQWQIPPSYPHVLQRVHKRMEKDKGEGGGRIEEAEGKAGQ